MRWFLGASIVAGLLFVFLGIRLEAVHKSLPGPTSGNAAYWMRSDLISALKYGGGFLVFSSLGVVWMVRGVSDQKVRWDKSLRACSFYVFPAIYIGRALWSLPFLLQIFESPNQNPSGSLPSIGMWRFGTNTGSTLLPICVLAIILWLYLRSPLRRFSKNQCMECGYLLIGNTSGICPECGTPIPDDLKEKRADSGPGRERK